MSYEAIIWDCDGVLIDSEVIACGVARDVFAELGRDIPLDEYITRFTGKSIRQAIEELAPENNFPFEDYKRRQAEAFSAKLKPVDGIEHVLKNLRLPMAIASGSELKRLEHCLGITGLLPYFNGHVYSSEMVARGKPAPDVFLYAAEKLGVKPENCLVIEDGVHGTHGAIAAGMDVYGYAGGCHMTPALTAALANAGVKDILNHISEVLALVQSEWKKAS